ncbi:phosphonate ABC transporter substrate-binding protein [Geminicoccaceae bacterium 1502E]|nr:phosphonate ABC transporter substrate-binding protein [Geminicoccaceae bacterium 1502E]
MLRRTLAALTIAATAAVAPAQAEDEINFGIISTESSSNLKTTWAPFLADMEKGTGYKINAFFASDYAGIIEGMRFNKVQLAWYGNKSAMEAVDRADGEVFAQTVASNGSEGYFAHILVHKDSPFQSLDDVLKCDQSLDFGIGDPNSTSGFLVPTTFVFSARNIDPKQCFKTVRNANHEANALAVANKLVDAAANNSESLERLEKTNPAARENIRVVWTSPLIPSDPLVWRKDLDAGVKEKISSWLLSYGNSGNPDADAKAQKILLDLGWAPFKKSDNNQLLPIRQMELNKDIMKLQGDEKMPAADRAAKLKELQAEFEEVSKKLAALKK